MPHVACRPATNILTSEPTHAVQMKADASLETNPQIIAAGIIVPQTF